VALSEPQSLHRHLQMVSIDYQQGILLNFCSQSGLLAIIGQQSL